MDTRSRLPIPAANRTGRFDQTSSGSTTSPTREVKPNTTNSIETLPHPPPCSKRSTPAPIPLPSAAEDSDDPLYMSFAGILLLMALFLLVWSSAP